MLFCFESVVAYIQAAEDGFKFSDPDWVVSPATAHRGSVITEKCHLCIVRKLEIEAEDQPRTHVSLVQLFRPQIIVGQPTAIARVNIAFASCVSKLLNNPDLGELHSFSIG